MSKTIEIPDRLSVYGDAVLQASADEGKPRRFRTEAYTGGLIRHQAYPAPVVINVAGVKPTNDTLPILADHAGTLEAAVGHTDSLSFDNAIIAEGPFSGANAATKEVIDKLDGGMALQASVGVRFKQADTQVYDEGEVLEANGRTFEGPVIYVSKAELYEISITPIGADSQTSVSLAASFNTGGPTVDPRFNEWCSDRGIDASAIAEDKLKTLQATYAAETKKVAGDVVLQAGGDGASLDDEIVKARKARAAEAARCDSIELICSGAGNPEIEVGGETMTLKAHAMAEGWNPEKTELYALRHSRQQAPAAHIRQSEGLTDKVLECSLAMQVNGDKSWIEKHYDEKTLEAAASRRYRSIGIQQAMAEQIIRCGGTVTPGTHGDNLIHAYKENVLQASGFGTVSLPNILGEVANKSVQSNFEKTPETYSQISATESNRNFQTFTKVRFTSGLKFEDVGKDGELKSGKLHEETYTTKVDTAGLIIQLTRQDIINDDLGMFAQLPSQIGRQGAITRDKEMTTLIEGLGTDFFAVGKNSLKTSNALSFDGITAALNMFAAKTDKAGDLIATDPAILLVPQALEATALRLMASTTFNETTTADSPSPDQNIYAGRFRVVVNKRLTSATTWYMLADPRDEAAFVNLTLNGQNGPVVEQVATPADVLGVTWQAYMDKGATTRAHEAIVKCTA